MSNSNILSPEWNALNYKKYGIPQFEIALDALSKWDFKGNEQVLDIGCGNGSITHYMAKKYLQNGSITGIDLSKDMISLALQEFKADNLNFENIDASDLAFKNKFDLVTSFYCIHWIKNKQKVLDGIANSLKHNGKALLYLMYDDPKLKHILKKIITNIVESPKWSSYFKNYKIPLHLPTVESFKHAIANAKLETLKFENVNKEFYFKDNESLSSWFNALPFVNHIPQQIRGEVTADITRIYLDSILKDANEPVKFILPTIIVTAQKI